MMLDTLCLAAWILKHNLSREHHTLRNLDTDYIWMHEYKNQISRASHANEARYSLYLAARILKPNLENIIH